MASVAHNIREALAPDEPADTVGCAPFIPLAEFMAQQDEAQSWVVDGLLLGGGTSLLVGKPKVGKTILSDNLALAVARGEPFLGRRTLRGPVLLLSLEEHATQLRQRFRALCASDEPVNLHVGSAPPDPLGWLTEAIIAHQPALVVIDPLQRFTRFGDVNDYSRVYNKLEPLVALAREHGCHILLCHHAGKLEGADVGDSPLGSTALFGAVDSLLFYRRDAEGNRVLESRTRYGTDLAPTIIALDPETGAVRAAGEVGAVEQRQLEQHVLDALGQGDRTEPEVREECRLGTKVVNGALNRLVRDGLVIRSGSGTRGDAFRYRAA